MRSKSKGISESSHILAVNMNREICRCIEHKGDVGPLSSLNTNTNAILCCVVAYASRYGCEYSGLKSPNYGERRNLHTNVSTEWAYFYPSS
jgi:hypothetical protein